MEHLVVHCMEHLVVHSSFLKCYFYFSFHRNSFSFSLFFCRDVMCSGNTEGKGGGALLIANEHFIAANGYSTMYQSCGGEEDDLALRYLLLGINIGAHRTLTLFRGLGHLVYSGFYAIDILVFPARLFTL